jgi:hypothetical protein
MPDPARVKRLILGQGGSTLIELVVAMPIATLAVGLSVQFFASANAGHRKVDARARALASAQVGLERMTRELRQADWVFFRDSQTVDLLAPVRAPGATHAAPRLVRFDCRSRGCRRYEGPPTGFPPPAGAVLAPTARLLEGLSNADVFHPQRIAPATGLASPDFLDPDSVILRARISFRANADDPPDLLEVVDGTSLRNNTRFRG